jgi:uncharacterized surface protein with fasciclin (FAS1) repeats
MMKLLSTSFFLLCWIATTRVQGTDAGTLAEIIEAGVAQGRYSAKAFASMNATDPNLFEQLKRSDINWTIFVPTEGAWLDDLDPAWEDKIDNPAWIQHRTAWVSYHFIGEPLYTSSWSEYVDTDGITTIEGTKTVLSINSESGGFVANGVDIITGDVQASNGTYRLSLSLLWETLSSGTCTRLGDCTVFSHMFVSSLDRSCARD